MTFINTNRTYIRHKTLDELKAQCAACGVKIFSDCFELGMRDDVVVSFPDGGATVIYKPITGYFVGAIKGGIGFTNHSARFENERWYQDLMEFFYTLKIVEEGAAA
jgi:hypothetical protein